MEELEYLIRTLTHKRSCLELDKNKRYDHRFGPLDSVILHLQGKIDGLNFAINEIYKLTGQMSLDSQNKLIEHMEKGEWTYGTESTEIPE